MCRAIAYSSPISAARSTSLRSTVRANARSRSRKAISAASRTSSFNKERTMSENHSIQRVAVIGTGVIGASWAALFLAKGLDVTATDVAPDAEANLKGFIDAAWPALARLG